MPACGSPPMTADSTISVSHFQGARSDPSTTATSSVSGVRRRRAGCLHVRLRLRRVVRARSADRVRAPRRPGATKLRLARRAVELRDLGEREVLGEAARRELFAGTCEDREERAARRMRAARAALEPAGIPGWSGDPAPAERVLEQADVVLAAIARSTAISSNGTPRVASSRIRRAISTHSRPSPGAEKNRTSPAGVRVLAAGVLANR